MCLIPGSYIHMDIKKLQYSINMEEAVSGMQINTVLYSIVAARHTDCRKLSIFMAPNWYDITTQGNLIE